MALGPNLIQNSSDHLDDITKELYKVLFKSNNVYKQNSAIYVLDVDSKMTAAEGTVKARMLNALMKQIEKLGVGEVAIKGDRDGVYWDQETERQALVSEAFYVLFDDISITIPGVIPSQGLYGDFAVGQRPCYQLSSCNYCGCSPCIPTCARYPKVTSNNCC